VNAETKEFVRARAQGRCEYCHYPEWLSEAPFQVDHVIAQQHGGHDDPENLAVAALIAIARKDQISPGLIRSRWRSFNCSIHEKMRGMSISFGTVR